jgi:hypothetical protein
MTRKARFVTILPIILLLFSPAWLRPVCAQTPSVVFNGNNTHSGTETFATINKVIFWDGIVYPFTAAGLQLAINTACSGGIPGRVIFPPQAVTGLTATSNISSSNCTLEGAGKNVSTIQASATLNAVVLQIGSVSHIKILNIGIDGNRSDNGGANTNIFDCFDLSANTSDVLISGIRETNCRGDGTFIFNGASHITIENSEFDHIGVFGATSDSYAINIFSNGGPGIFDVRIGPNNIFHDNWMGIQVTTAANGVSGLAVFDNTIYSNASDAINILGQNSAGVIMAPRFENNEIYCNGWPANGSGFSPNCTPGFLQTGSVTSGGGVGIDLLSNSDQRVVHPIISGNHIHDGTFEGVALTSNFNTVVNTSGTSVTWVSGVQFNTNWKAGQTLFLGPLTNSTAFYKIASVSSATSLTLASSAGTQTGIALLGPTFMWATITGNEFLGDGYGSGGPGPGLYNQFTDGNVFGQNIYKNGSNAGLVSFGGSFNSINGDHAYSNCRVSCPFAAGFTVLGGLGNSYSGIVTDDPVASPTQTIGVWIDANSTNTLIISDSLYGSVGSVGGGGFGIQGNIYVTQSSTNANLLLNEGVNGISFQHAGFTNLVPQSAGGNFILTLPAATGTVTENTQNVPLRQQQAIADQGSICTNGELTLSAGWGAIATVTAVAGTGQTCQWTITSAGAGQAANPTITDTLTNALPTATTICDMRMVGGTGTATLINQTLLSATAPIFTFGGTPVAGSTYKVVRRCGP